LAGIVVSREPWCQRSFRGEDADVDAPSALIRVPVKLEECADITKAPPPTVKQDLRGIKSKYCVIIGFAYIKQKIIRETLNKSKRDALAARRGNLIMNEVRKKKKMVLKNIPVWHVMRQDGMVFTLTNVAILDKLYKQDDKYLEDIIKGYASPIKA
jgi:hypothetical protein